VSAALDLEGYARQLSQRVASAGADIVINNVEYEPGNLAARVSIVADLPGSGHPNSSRLELTDSWARSYRDRPWRLSEYTYELLDYERDARYALHFHDAEWFVNTFHVAVHEHCENPIGITACQHYRGDPVDSGYDAVGRLLRVWTEDEPIRCDALTCLETRT
jgi:hypothetical protein